MHIVTWANCTGNVIAEILSSTSSMKGSTVKCIINYQHEPIITEPFPFDELSKADFFIYQPLNKHKEFEKRVISLLKPDCKKVSFPYIYNNAIQPITKEIILDLKQQGKSCEQIIDDFHRGKTDCKFESRIQNTINILRKKEDETDVKVCNFILLNMYKERMFYNSNHPTGIVLAYCANQILERFGFAEKIDIWKIEKNIYKMILRGTNYFPISQYEKAYYNFTWFERCKQEVITNPEDITEEVWALSFYSNLIWHYYNGTYPTFVF
jgi:hypothetical protein